MLNYQRVPPWPERSEFVFRFNLYEQLKLLQLRKFKSCNNFWTRLGWMMIDLTQLYLAFRVCLWPVACNVLFHGFHCFSIFFNIFNIDWKRHLTCYCMKINAKGTIVKGHIFQGNRVDSAVSIPWRGDTGQVATAAKSWEGGGSSPVSGWHKAYVPLICTLKQTAPKILQSVSKRESERESVCERINRLLWPLVVFLDFSQGPGSEEETGGTAGEVDLPRTGKRFPQKRKAKTECGLRWLDHIEFLHPPYYSL